MIESYGIPYKITEPIVGRILTYDDPSLSNFPHIYIGNNANTANDFCAFISESPMNSENINDKPGLFSVKNIGQFLHGDGVTLLPEGKVLLVYRSKSNSNTLFVTSRCDSSCLMCPQPPHKKDAYDFADLAFKIVNIIDPEVEIIGITGGEPTLLGKKLFLLLEKIKNKFPLASLHILTNGRYFCNTEIARSFSMIKHPGVLVGIPVFSDNPYDHDEITRAQGSFNQTVKGIINLASFGIPIEIRIVMIRQVISRLDKLVEFIYRNFPFVSQVCFMGLEPIGYAKKNFKEVWIDPIEYQETLKNALNFLALRGVHTNIYNEQLCILKKELWKYNRKSISDWKNNFLIECFGCAMMDKCGGFFEASLNGLHSCGIHKLLC